jgi:hypothetical protein
MSRRIWGCVMLLAPLPAYMSPLSEHRTVELYHSLVERLQRVRKETQSFCKELKAERRGAERIVAAAHANYTAHKQHVFAVMRSEAAVEGVPITALNPADFGLATRRQASELPGSEAHRGAIQAQHACINLLTPLTMGVRNLTRVPVPQFRSAVGGFGSPLATAQHELEGLLVSLTDTGLVQKGHYVASLGQNALEFLSKIRMGSNMKTAGLFSKLHHEFSSITAQARAFKIKMLTDLARLQQMQAAVIKAQTTLKARALKQALLGPTFRQLQQEYRIETKLLFDVQNISRQQILAAQ